MLTPPSVSAGTMQVSATPMRTTQIVNKQVSVGPPRMLSLGELLRAVSGFDESRVIACAPLREGTTLTPAVHGSATVCVLANTQCEINLCITQIKGKQTITGGQVVFNPPVKIKNVVKSFSTPHGPWKHSLSLLNRATSYTFKGVQFAPDGSATLLGRINVLHGIHSRHLDQLAATIVARVSRNSDPATGTPLRVPPAALAAHAATRLIRGNAPVSLEVRGHAPPELALGAGSNFVKMQGGPFCIRSHGVVSMLSKGRVSAVVASPTHTLEAAALHANLEGRLQGKVWLDPGHKIHLRATGQAHVLVGRACFEVRPKESPSEGGVLVRCGDLRQARPLVPALSAPLVFNWDDGVINAQGTAQLGAAATFLNPHEPMPTDDKRALDVRGAMDLRLSAGGKINNQTAAGTLFLKPPDSTDSFGYHLQIADGKVDFEPVPKNTSEKS